MKNYLFLFAFLFAVSACSKKEEIVKKSLNSAEISVDYEDDNGEIDSDNEDEGARIEAGLTTLLYYQLQSQSMDFTQNYTLKYWVYDNEPDLSIIKSEPDIYEKPKGRFSKKGLRLTGSKSLPHNKWIVIEEPNDMKMYKFRHEEGKKGLLWMLEENVNQYPDGYYSDNSKLKVSGLWGNDQKAEFNMYWIKYVGKSFATYPTKKEDSADGWIHLYSRDGAGDKKYMFMRFPVGKYHFFIESSPGVYSSALVEIKAGKVPYLKLAFTK